MIYISGDTHGDFERFDDFCIKNKTTRGDIMIILGDSGLNYNGSCMDDCTKAMASMYPLTFFCIHGNHEQRASNIMSYNAKNFCGGTVWYEEEYPNLLFAKDGEIYNFGGHECIAIGGAYSVDKMFRVSFGHPWYADEQPSEEIKAYVEKQLALRGNKIDVVLSHTSPRSYEPTEVFLSGINQELVDKTTEDWLDKIEKQIDYKYWYCGHYHTEKKIDKLRFMFMDIDVFMG